MKEKVILISIDGMRPDGFLQCGHPFVKQMLEQFSFCLQARSVVPPVTLPCHTSIFYGVEPARHGIITNQYHPPVRPIRGLAEQLEAAGSINAAFYNWEPMRHVWQSGSMKYSLYVDAYQQENTDAFLTGQAIDLIERVQPDFVYLYLVETDDKGGHDCGWMTEEYLRRVANAIDCVQQVFETAGENYHIFVTADHGGHGRDHGEDCPEDMTIPMFFYGRCFEKGKQLEGLNLMDLAPTIASLMGANLSREWEGNDWTERVRKS